MAFRTEIICDRCGEEKEVMEGYTCPRRHCDECKKAMEAEAQQKHRGALDKLTLEERVKRIEDILYKYYL